jgi:hypothetical protein
MDLTCDLTFKFNGRSFWVRETDVLEFTGVEYCDEVDEEYSIYDRRTPSKKIKNIYNLPDGWSRVELIQVKESVIKRENYHGVLREKIAVEVKTIHIARVVAELFMGLSIDDPTKAVRYINPKKAPVPSNLEIISV